MTTNEMLDRTASVLSAERVYAPAETRDGVTVIPAAAIRGGGGGGGGEDPEGDSGEGGGFGVHATPAGALVIKGDQVRWKVPFNLNRVIAGGQIVGISFFFFMWLTQRSKARAAVRIAKINARAAADA